MNSKVLEFLLKEMAYEIVEKGNKSPACSGVTDRLQELVSSSNGKIEKALLVHRPILKARLEKTKAELLAKIAEVDVILEEIKG